MKHTLLALALLSVVACASPTSAEQDRPALNKWADDRLWAVLEAQEHRDTKALCSMLQDTSGTVREAAALALASVQDSTSRPCLFGALEDPLAAVRAQAAYALGLVADSAGLVLLNASADAERDATAQQLMHEAGFKAELALRKHDAMFLISYLESDDRDIRARAAQQLARLPKEELIEYAPSVQHAIRVEKDDAVRLFLVGALKHNATEEVSETLRTLAVDDRLPMIRVAALRALGASENSELLSFFLDRLRDTSVGVQQTALEQIQRLPAPMDGASIWKVAQEIPDYSIKIPLFGLVLKTADDATRRACRLLLRNTAEQGELSPYLKAALIRARANDAIIAGNYPITDTSFLRTRHSITTANSAIERLASLETCIELLETAAREAAGLNGVICWSCAYDRTYMDSILTEALFSGDAGLIARAGEHLITSDTALIRMVLDEHTFKMAFSRLDPVRDLETLQMLYQAIAKRDGFPQPEHKAPPFNHPILRERLLLLKQGQQYRITTTKGEIIIATNVNETPGTSLAFDSLVTVGYYNGKAFHRVVPNFVIQGGCPRGDGYGGMPWTLRTEIGSTGFTTGSVGVASAGRDTESCQFFITHVPTPHLDGRYTKFAEVVSGMDVVQLIVVGDRMITVERVE